jgi:Peptidase A4 family
MGWLPGLILSGLLGLSPTGLAGTTSTSAPTPITSATNTHWSGYVATGAADTFTTVSATWIEPSVNCQSTQLSYAAFWDGLDGYNNSTVEQIGTTIECYNGHPQQFSWYDLYPQEPYEVSTNLIIHSGDVISASVTYELPLFGLGLFGSGTYQLELTDETTNQTFSTTADATSSEERSTAEVIAEALTSGGQVDPLSNFGSVGFSNASIDNSPLVSAPGLVKLAMRDPAGMTATPSAIDHTGEGFTVLWGS